MVGQGTLTLSRKVIESLVERILIGEEAQRNGSTFIFRREQTMWNLRQ